MKIHRDAACGAALLVLAGLYFYATLNLPPGRDEPGPAFFPLLLSGSLAVLSLALLVRGLRADTERTAPDTSTRKVLAAMAFTILYAAAFTPLGFVLSTWLYTLSVTVTFSKNRPLVPVVVPIASTLTIYLLFEVGLGARLPPGFWA